MNSLARNGWWHGRLTTVTLCVVMVLLNWPLFGAAGGRNSALLSAVEFDRAAILHGEIWRLVTGDIVHWSREHFWLDVSAFLVIGVLFEASLGRRFPWLILASAASVGAGVLVFLPDLRFYRGLSGMDSGLFTAAVLIEIVAARMDKRRWIWTLPAAGVFAWKIAYEAMSGRLFFGTESLGDIGQPTPLAHVAGVIAAIAVLALALPRGTFRRRQIVSGTAEYVCPW